MYEVEYDFRTELVDALVPTVPDEDLESELPESRWETINGEDEEPFAFEH